MSDIFFTLGQKTLIFLTLVILLGSVMLFDSPFYSPLYILIFRLLSPLRSYLLSLF